MYNLASVQCPTTQDCWVDGCTSETHILSLVSRSSAVSAKHTKPGGTEISRKALGFSSLILQPPKTNLLLPFSIMLA